MKLKRILVMSGILLLLCSLNGFRPGLHNFASTYQYQMFQSWMRRGNFSADAPSRLSANTIKSDYKSYDNNLSVNVEFDIQRGLIVQVREAIDSVVTDSSLSSQELKYRKYMESLIFRLNCDQYFYTKDYADELGIKIGVDGASFDENISREYRRVKPESITFNQFSESKYYYQFDYQGLSWEFIFPEITFMDTKISKQKEKESKYLIEDLLFQPRIKTEVDVADKEDEAESYQVIFQPEFEVDEPKKIAESLGRAVSPAGKTMSEYIAHNKNQRWGRELLYNRISDYKEFIKNEFPHHNYTEQNKNIALSTGKFRDTISADLSLERIQLRDGIDFRPFGNFSISDNRTVTLSTGEMLDLNELSLNEVYEIVPYLNQLLAMHRVIGTKMVNFLLIPADVPTTLVLRDPERDVIEFSSYTNLILMLSNYWQGRTVYFNLETVKKVNNYIELSGFLAAENAGQELLDFAEVKFALDLEYKIDIAMMILHTNVSRE